MTQVGALNGSNASNCAISQLDSDMQMDVMAGMIEKFDHYQLWSQIALRHEEESTTTRKRRQERSPDRNGREAVGIDEQNGGRSGNMPKFRRVPVSSLFLWTSVVDGRPKSCILNFFNFL